MTGTNGRQGNRFRTTSWTLIGRAISDPEAKELLLQRYWSPVYAYLVNGGRQTADAGALTQDFLTHMLLESTILVRADPTVGRFRSLLLAALQRFVCDQHRREHGRGRKRPQLVPTDPEVLASVQPDCPGDPVDAYGRQWAAATLHEAVSRAEQYYMGRGLADHWRVYEGRVVNPVLYGTEPIPYEQLQEEIGKSRAQLSSMQETVNRCCRRMLRIVVADTVADEDLDDEVAFVTAALGG